MSWQLIEDDAALAALLSRYAGSLAVAVDTEFMRRNTFYPQPALLQLCFDDQAWLIDPTQVTQLGPLRELFSNPEVVKVLHSPSEDLEVFQHWLGVQPSPLFDTQRAAALCNLGFGLGYRALVLELLDSDLPKGETRSDWLQRPLTPSQCEYAALDVIHLLPVYELLRARCDEQGKTGWVLDDGADAIASASASSGPGVARIKNAWRLDPRQLAALVDICAWREEVATQRDKPRNWIIDDKACFAIASELPEDAGALGRLDELPHPARRRYSEDLLQIVADALDLPESELPAPLPSPLGAEQRDLLKRLKSAAKSLAQQLGTAPEILLPSKDYELLVRKLSGESLPEPSHWNGWRAEVVVQPLLQRMQERAS